MKEDFFDLDLKVSEVSMSSAPVRGLNISVYPNGCPNPPTPSTKETNCSFIPPCAISN